MEVSKLTFTQGFQEQAKKSIGPRKVAVLRKQRLKEAEEKGTLQMCKNRADIGKLLGIPAGIRTSQYVYNAIKRGEITETLLAVKDGVPEYEYHYRNNKFSLNKPIKNRSFDEFVKNFSVEKNEDVYGIEIVIDWNKHTLNVKNITVDSIVAIVKELAK
jgi:hypothetical protein